MDFFIYILHSLSFDKFYIGYTDNPKRRFLEHNESTFSTYTSKFRPWKMVALFKVTGSRPEALRIEKFLKNQKSKSLTLKLINPEFIPNGNLALLVRVPHVRD
mgnify:CR=1 FL=1